MKSVTIYLTVLLAGLSLVACSQEQAPEKKEQPAASTAPAEQSSAGQLAEQAEQQAKQAADTVKEKAQEVAAAAKEQTSEAVDKMQSAAKDASTAVKETMQPVIPVETDVKTVAPSVPQTETAGPLPTGPTTVVYEASMGQVTFNHAEHAARLDCSQCHSTDPPQKIAIDKEVAHNQLCKTCHKESGGEAPTACAGCHKK